MVLARHLTADRGSLVALTTAAFLVVSGVFFVLKFVICETLVLTRALDAEPDVDRLVRSSSVEPALVLQVPSDVTRPTHAGRR